MIFRHKAGIFTYSGSGGYFSCWGTYDKLLQQWAGPILNEHDAKRIARAKNWQHFKAQISGFFGKRPA